MADKRVTGEWERKTNRAGKEKHPTQFHVNIRDFIADVMFAVNALPALVRTVTGISCFLPFSASKRAHATCIPSTLIIPRCKTYFLAARKPDHVIIGSVA